MDDTEGGRPVKRPSVGAGDGVGPSGGGAGVPDPAQSSFTKLGLQPRTIKELQTVLKAWNLPVSGKKDDLIQRILDRQRAVQGG